MAENLIIQNYKDAQSYRAYYDSVYTSEPKPFDPEFAAKIAGGISGKRVLDAGCGDGKFSEYLINTGNSPILLDFSLTAIAVARDNTHNMAFPIIPIMIEDAPPYTTPTTYIPEIVFAIDLLGECFDIPKALKRLCWQTKGHIILTVGLLTQKILEHKDEVLWNETFMTHLDWVSLFEEHQLEVEAVESYETDISERAIYKLKWM